MPDPSQERMDALSEAILRLLKKQQQIDERLTRIESALDLKPAEPPIPPAPLHTLTPPPVLPQPPPPQPQPVASPAPAQAPPPKPAPGRPIFETNIGLTLLNRVGVVTLVLGTGFFFKWAVENQWIGPAERVILGCISGLAILAAADFLWRKGQQVFAQGITAVGLGVLYLALYAAFGFYHLVPQGLAFFSLFATTALAVALALRYDSAAMAVLGFLAGYLTPLILSTGEDHPWFLFSYVLLLDAGAVWLMAKQRWRSLGVLSFTATVLLYGAWFSAKFAPEKRAVATWFALIYYALFAGVLAQPLILAAPLLAGFAVALIWTNSPALYFLLSVTIALAGLAISDLRRLRGAALASFAGFWAAYIVWSSSVESPKPIGPLFSGLTLGFLLFLAWIPWRVAFRKAPASAEDLIILATGAAAYFGASYALLDSNFHAWMGLFAVTVAGVDLALAAWIKHRRPGEQSTILLALGITATLLILAVPIQFTGYRITMAWSLEFLALSWIARRLTDARLPYGALLVSCLIWLRLLAFDAWTYSDPASYTLIWNIRFLTFLIAGVCSWLAAYWTRPHAPALVEYIAGHVIFLWGLTLEDLAWAARNSTPQNLLSVQTVSISILYALYALVWVGAGVATRRAIHRISGLSLIGLVIAKLYLFDVWQLGRLYRIWAFVGLGALLLAISFLYSHFRALIESWWKNEQTPS